MSAASDYAAFTISSSIHYFRRLIEINQTPYPITRIDLFNMANTFKQAHTLITREYSFSAVVGLWETSVCMNKAAKYHSEDLLRILNEEYEHDTQTQGNDTQALTFG